MKLLSLQVKGAACFRNPLRLEGLDPHINVIYGPNEIGKSTLITSLARAFFDKSSTRAQEVESLRPWGTTLSPEIVVEFVAGHDKRYKLEKGFLDNPYSRLSEWTGRGYELLADGDKAEEAVRGMWRSSVPGRGATKIDHWGYARLLWFGQDQERFERPPLNDQTLLNELRETLDVMTISKEEEALFGALQSELAAIVTSKQRNFATRSRIAALLQEKQELVASIASIEEKLASVEELSDRVAQLKTDIGKRTSDREVKKRELTALKDRVEDVKKLRGDLKIAKSELSALKSQQATLSQDRETVRKARETIGELEKELQSTKEKLERIEKEVTDSEELVTEKHRELNGLRDRVAAAKSKLERCRRIKQLRNWSREIDQKRELLKRLEDLTGQLEGVKVELKSMSIPSENELRKAEELKASIASLEAKLEAVGLSFQVKAHADVSFEFDCGESHETLRLNSGELALMHASRQAVLSVPGLLSVTVKSGSDEAASVQEKLSKSREELEALLAKFDVTNTTDLHKVVSRGDRLRDDKKRLKNEIKGLGVTDRLDLEAEIKRLGSQLESGLNKEGLAADELDTVDPGDEEQLSDAYDRLEKAERSLQEELVKLRETVSDLRERRGKLQSQIETNSGHCDLERARVCDVLSKYGGDEASLKAAYNDLCLEIDRKKAVVDDLEAKLPPDSEDPERRWEALQTELENIERDLESKQNEMSWIEGRLEQLTAGDLYLEKARSEERLELIERELHRELVRARALSLIQVLFDEHRKAMSSGLSKPIEDKVSSYWGFVRGQADVRAVLGPDMELASLDVNGVGAEPESFSAGAREQLYVVTRLSVAELLSSREPQIVVLDDALVFTDSHRHDRMLELLKRLSEKMQVLILTSHEDRFCALPGARFDIAALRNRALLA